MAEVLAGRSAAATLVIMSTVEGWDMTVPEDAHELLAELRRHGVHPGQRLRVVPAAVEPPEPAAEGEPETQRRRFRFAGTLADAEPDLASNVDHYLERGFGRQ